MKIQFPRSAKLALILTVALAAGAALASAQFTPMSPAGYSGVAPPTTGRAAVTETSVASRGVTPVAPAAVVTTLPPGCAQATVANVVYRKCGATYYRPYYQGSSVVYVPAKP